MRLFFLSRAQVFCRTFNLAPRAILFENSRAVDGVVAQLVEHHNGIVGVRGSNPLGSTIYLRRRNRKADALMRLRAIPEES